MMHEDGLKKEEGIILTNPICKRCSNSIADGVTRDYFDPGILTLLWNRFEDIKDLIKKDKQITYNTAEPIMKICRDAQEKIKEKQID